MNWPTAFVIAVAICAGAFLYNKPSDAALGGSQGSIMRIKNLEYWLQTDDRNQRVCTFIIDDIDHQKSISGIGCTPWKTD